MSPQSFYTHFQKALRAVKLLDCYYEKELNDNEAKIIFFYAFPKGHIQDHVRHKQRNFDDQKIEDLKNFFKVTLIPTPPRKMISLTIVETTGASQLHLAPRLYHKPSYCSLQLKHQTIL